MKDYILRAVTENGDARIFIATSKNTVNEAFKIHKTSPVVSAAFGRMLTAGAIMGCMIKNKDDLVTISMKGNGKMKGVLVTSDSKSRVKGYVNVPIVDLPLKPNGKLDVGGAIGEGVFTVIQDMGLKEPYVGQVPLITGEVADDLTYYYAKSEQTPTAVSLGVLVDTDYSIKYAGGFIIQMMPNADELIVSKLEASVLKIDSMTNLLSEYITPEKILEVVLDGIDYKITDKIPMEYYCNCSRERVENALISVGKKELTEILQEDKKANIHCHFCANDYDFSEEDLIELIKSID
jgi:molecular chaperone Hsp33